MKRFLQVALFSALLSSGWALATIQDNSQSATEQPDNTKVNQQDRGANRVTADQQKMDPGDRETTKQIRQAITRDKSISTYGHNVKVITQNGTVTLKGPVRSEEEKQAIEAKAEKIVGPENVTDDLEVKPKQ